MADYSGLGKSLGSAIESGYKAKSKAYEREASQELWKYRQLQKRNLFDVLYGAIGLGSNLYDVYSENQRWIGEAEEKGYKVTSNWLTNLFGTPEYLKDGETFTQADIAAKKTLGVL